MSGLLELLPPGSATEADGMLIIGGCRVDDLAEEFGTPLLVVAEEALRARAREYVAGLTSRWPSSRVVLASKAFPCTAVQRVMVQEGLGLDVAGGGEILTALKAGVDPALIVLHGNAKTSEEITMAVEGGVGADRCGWPGRCRQARGDCAGWTRAGCLGTHHSRRNC
jgi:diaminopimelate decarboxylase